VQLRERAVGLRGFLLEDGLEPIKGIDRGVQTNER
jgi:hypothetical protein